MSATDPLNPAAGVPDREYVAGVPLTTVSLPTAPPFTVIAKVPPCTPVPLNGIDMGDAGSELRIVNVPEREPKATGVKATPTAQLLPGASTACGQGTLTAKSPLLDSARFEIGVDPAFNRVSDALVELPRSVFPKARADDPMTSSDCVSIPVRTYVRGMVVADEVSESKPLRMPVAEGLKVTEIIQLA